MLYPIYTDKIRNWLVVDDLVLENVLLDHLKYRWSTLSALEVDFRMSHSLHHYNLVIFTYLLGELMQFINESSSKQRCIKCTKAVVEERQTVVDY